MKAAFFDQPGSALQLRDVPDLVPAADQVVVSVSHCGICSSDLHMTDGKGAYVAPKDSVLGHEIAGVVIAIGAKVKDIDVGEHVAVIPLSGCENCEYCGRGEYNQCSAFEWHAGGYAETILTRAQYCFKLAQHLPISDGALVEPMAVALRAARHAQLTKGQKVVIFGAGPIGLSCIYWARHFGCEAIVVMASSTRRQTLAMAMGATHFVVNKDFDPQAVLDALGDAPDIVIECAGVPGMIGLAVDLVKPHSTVVVPGWCTQQDSFMPMTAMQKELRLQFTALYSSDDFQYVVDTMAADTEAKYRAMVTDTVLLSELPVAFEKLRQPGNEVKVMVTPNT
jgi:(R,R)-butanediol dehydrogenase/meso-butanediol dehydrogenase/diacetyl reductase